MVTQHRPTRGPLVTAGTWFVTTLTRSTKQIRQEVNKHGQRENKQRQQARKKASKQASKQKKTENSNFCLL
jgi:hypothetical protein